jgi:dCMP deaminase
MEQNNLDELFMDFAIRSSEESHCNRNKVGAVIVQNNATVICIGWNGMPAGDDNCCEDEHNYTKLNVIHAEDNAYRKLLRLTETAIGSVMYTTVAPCERCANIIADSGTVRVIYLYSYANDDGLKKLRQRGIEVYQMIRGL